MKLEAQCLAMAEDCKDFDVDLKPGQNYKRYCIDKYTTREAVVEAIRRNESNKIFKKYFSIEVNEVVYRRSGTLDNFFGLATIEACDLREAYLRARGLWVEESEDHEKEKIELKIAKLENELSQLAQKFPGIKKEEEEVVLPSNREIMLKPKSEMTELEKFILYYDPFQIPLEEETEKLSQEFRNRLKSVLEEARRGK